MKREPDICFVRKEHTTTQSLAKVVETESDSVFGPGCQFARNTKEKKKSLKFLHVQKSKIYIVGKSASQMTRLLRQVDFKKIKGMEKDL